MKNIQLGNIERQSIAEKVVNNILLLIQSGNLRPGDKLPSEKELMTVFSISRPTLREALRALSVLGVIYTNKGGRSYISELKAANFLRPLEFFFSIENQTIQDIFECRKILECQMVAKAAKGINKRQIIELEKLIEVQKTAIDDPISFRISDQKFHELLATASGNKMLVKLADTMYNMAMEERREATNIDGVISQSIKDHIEIVDALKIKNSELAYEAMEKHLSNIEKSTLFAMNNS